MEHTSEESFERIGEIVAALSLIERDGVAFLDEMITGIQDGLQRGALPPKAAQLVPVALDSFADRRKQFVDGIQRAREALDEGAAETLSGFTDYTGELTPKNR